MNNLQLKQSLEYRGIHFLDVMSKNQQNEGNIINITFSIDDHFTTYILTTEYNEGLTYAEEELKYFNDYLITWSIRLNNKEKYTVFCRDELNKQLDKK